MLRRVVTIGRSSRAPSWTFSSVACRGSARLLASAPVRSNSLAGGAVVAGALVAGIGIGIAVPAHWFQPRERAFEAPPAVREDSAVYEDVREIAEDIPRPAIIVDVTREGLEALYEFHSCLASGGSATVWRATELSTGRAVAIKVIDKKLLQEAFLYMEVASLRRCAGHPNIMQLLAAYDVQGDEVCPDGEWHLVMELAEGGGTRAPNASPHASAPRICPRSLLPRRAGCALVARALATSRRRSQLSRAR